MLVKQNLVTVTVGFRCAVSFRLGLWASQLLRGPWPLCVQTHGCFCQLAMKIVVLNSDIPGYVFLHRNSGTQYSIEELSTIYIVGLHTCNYVYY